MTHALLTPYTATHAVELGSRVYRKQILKAGPISYAGRAIDFTRDYLAELVDNFRTGVIDQVPFQLADAGNRHTNDPERTRGVIKGLELTDDGLDAIVELTDDGARVVEQNPALGVSARILEDVQYADGRKAGRVLQHVLGTLDPHLAGMRPWQAVTLSSNTDVPVVDLTGAPYETETLMAQALTDDELARVRALIAGTDNNDSDPQEPAADQQGDVADVDDVNVEAELKAFGIDDLDAFLASLDEGDGQGEPEDDDEGDSDGDAEDGAAEHTEQPLAAAALANDDAQLALDLSAAQTEQNTIELARVRDELDEANYAREREQIARDYGIPPRIVDLAKPLLKGTGHTLDLANGEQADAGQIVRTVFTELGQQIKLLDLSGELGHAIDMSRTDEEKQQRAELDGFVKSVREQYIL